MEAQNSYCLLENGTRTSVGIAVSSKPLGELFFEVQGLGSSVGFYCLEVLP